MVRLKTRYLICAVSSPPSLPSPLPSDLTIAYSNNAAKLAMTHDEVSLKQEASRGTPGATNAGDSASSTAPTTTLQTTPSDIYHSLLPTLTELYGVTLTASIQSALHIRHYSNTSSLLLIRCPRSCYRKVWAGLTAMREVRGKRVCVTVKGVAGSSRTARIKLEVLGKEMKREVQEFMKVL